MDRLWKELRERAGSDRNDKEYPTTEALLEQARREGWGKGIEHTGYELKLVIRLLLDSFPYETVKDTDIGLAIRALAAQAVQKYDASLELLSHANKIRFLLDIYFGKAKPHEWLTPGGESGLSAIMFDVADEARNIYEMLYGDLDPSGEPLAGEDANTSALDQCQACV